MRFEALAIDYDGTLAEEGIVEWTTVAALKRLRATGRRPLLVTGRTIEDLVRIFSQLNLFEVIVGENGAVLYYPATGKIKLLHDPPPSRFVEELQKRGIPGLYKGHVIVATEQPHEVTVVNTIKDLGLELQIIFNKGSVMILPTGVNKATGLCAALEIMGLSAKKVVGIGDAENDHALLHYCGYAVAVNNAVPSLKKEAQYVTKGNAGRGVTELIDFLVNDLDGITPQVQPEMAM